MRKARRHGSSLAWRIFTSVSVLLAFVGTLAAIIGTLFAVPLICLYLAVTGDKGPSGGLGWAILFGSCWGCSFLLARGLFGMRPGRFEPPSQPLRRDDAPALFRLVDEIAQAAATAPPVEIYLSPFPQLSVVDTGGLFGLRSRRVLIIGAPMLGCSSVAELRAGIAHELGHFIGGDTRLGGVLAFTENAFRSVLFAATTKHTYDSFIGLAYDLAQWLSGLIVRVYVKLYLLATRPSARRQELAADRLSAELAGRDATIRMLEKAHVISPIYSAYLTEHVERALHNDILPTDILAGFTRFRSRWVERGLEEKVAKAVADEKTDPFDTHPSLAERIEHLHGLGDEVPSIRSAADESHSAESLLDGALALEEWMTREVRVRATETRRRPLRSMTWDGYIHGAIPELVHERNREAQLRVGGAIGAATSATTLFRALVDAYEAGHLPMIVVLVAPDVQHFGPPIRQQLDLEIAASYLTAAFQAALLERGAEVEGHLGEPFTKFRFEGETVAPGEHAFGSMTDDAERAAIRRWAERLAEPVPVSIRDAVA